MKKQPGYIKLVDGRVIDERDDTTLEIGTAALTVYISFTKPMLRPATTLERLLAIKPKARLEKSRIPCLTIPWHRIALINWGYDIRPTEETKQTTPEIKK